ncbi:IS66 family insertion sequence element accessory protein TnpB [Pandoraea fibrosis]|uniref:IS66 family insertion sequence element accessory protein TnpB n=1 Tax=Pandoraea fibrosis TaxID=1891094 RepID=UPI00123FBC8E
MIRVDQIWLAIEPMDMRAGSDTALARVVKVFGAAHPHHAHLFANCRGNRMKVLMHDGRRMAGGEAPEQGPFRLARRGPCHGAPSLPRSGCRRWCSGYPGSAWPSTRSSLYSDVCAIR